MKILDPEFDIEIFFQSVGSAHQRGLLLDYDGTLAPFTADRQRAVPYPGIRERLEKIVMGGHTRVALISGRTVSEVAALLNLRLPVEMWGSHGWERRMGDGQNMSGQPSAELLRDLAVAEQMAEPAMEDRLEIKPFSLALHWRGLDTAARDALESTMRPRWESVAREDGLELHDFDGGMELRIPGRDKGYAVQTLRGELGPGAAIAYLGDDLTDEDAFDAVAPAGTGFLVRTELRPTRAACWLRPPEDLLAFLDRWEVECPQGA